MLGLVDEAERLEEVRVAPQVEVLVDPLHSFEGLRLHEFEDPASFPNERRRLLGRRVLPDIIEDRVDR
jgi:hypothetical protein